MAIIPVDTPWPRLGGKLYVAGGYGPQELFSTENARPWNSDDLRFSPGEVLDI